MPHPLKPVVTLKAVAQRAGLSLATVSYALRKHPKIPAETRAHVEQAAERLGYRPNPRVASLMAHIRGAHSGAHRECLAFVWMHVARQESRKDPFLNSVFVGAQQRAQQTGFALEEFWTSDPGMTDRRLEQILRSRGIVGVVLSPVTTAEASITLDWNWNHFAPAVIGNVTWTPELHHAGHHHFLGMRMALLELAKLGYTRPAALLDQHSNERSKRAWEAAFLTHHPHAKAANSLVRLTRTDDQTELASWLQDCGADTLIVSGSAVMAKAGLRAACLRLRLPIFTLHWSNEAPRATGGIDQCYDRVAAQAVDLVAAQLNANETGAPDLARIMLFPGCWVAPKSIPRARPRRPRMIKKKRTLAS